MEHFLASRGLAAMAASPLFGTHANQLSRSEESKKLTLHEILKNIENELEAMRTDTECVMAVLTSNLDKMSALDKKIQELRKLYQLNDISRATKELFTGESESRPSTSRKSFLDNLPQSTANNSGSSTAQSINKRINDSTLGEPSPKKPNTNTTEEIVSALRPENLLEEYVPPEVLKAAEITKGVLSPIELLSFLYLSQNIDSPVELAKVSFTSDIELLYCQLFSLKINVQKTCDTAETKSRDLIKFQERLDVLVALFESRIK